MLNLKTVYKPENLKEFSKIYRKNSFIIAGSTYFYKSMLKNPDVKEIIDINSLDLKYIKQDNRYLKIGSLSTFDDLENSKICQKYFFGFLSYAASRCSSQLIRNMATVGGNIAHPNAFNIIPLLVETLDGLISVYDGKNKKRFTLSDYYKYRKGLITEILFPLKYNKDIFYFEKIAKIQSSWEGYITFSFRARVKNGRIEDIKLVFGSINSLPVYSKELEDEIKNSVIDDKFIKYISDKYSNYIFNIHPSHKYSNYRREVVYNTVSEFISKISRR